MKNDSGSVLVVIPARYPSTRFPAKPLADLDGKPMVQHVWERATRSKKADRVIVATDDDRIEKCVRSFGGEAALTSSDHRTGTERVAEVAARFLFPVVVNLQGDLPLFQPHVLDRLIEVGKGLFDAGTADLVTAKAKIDSEDEIFSPNTVKVVSDRTGRALYFSRSPVPYIDKASYEKLRQSISFYKHYGIYLYHRDFLLNIAKTQEGELERIERLEQLRVLEEGGRVHVVEIERSDAQFFHEVNTPEDLVKAREILSSSM